MTEEELNILTSESVRSTLRENLDKDPAFFALSQKDNTFPVPLVSTQLKYLQKAKHKLPTYYNHLCIIPPLAYEQSSSERAAFLKKYAGHRCLDLTMGLGVDSWHFSQSFDQVISLELNPALVRIAKKNFQLLGRNNIEVLHQLAESFLDSYEGPAFDLIYLDPARRDERGRRIHDLEACQPNVFGLMPLLKKYGKRIVIKASPLYDINEARKKIPAIQRIYAHSLQNELKELILEVDPSFHSQSANDPQIEAVIAQKDQTTPYSFEWEQQDSHANSLKVPPAFLYEPDVAFYKIRKLPELFSRYFNHLPGSITHKMGFFLSGECLEDDFPGRIFVVRETLPYKPKELKRFFKREGVERAHIVSRNFPFAVARIRQELRLKEGGDLYLIATQWNGKNVVFVTERKL